MTGRLVQLPKSANVLWRDEELAGAVEVYVFLLRLQIAGIHYRKEDALKLLTTGPLNVRNDASIRYRMRNISAVVSELGAPILNIYSPASQVGRNVHERIRTMLLVHPGFAQILQDTSGGGSSPANEVADPQSEALARLAALRLYVDDLERQLLGVGHNRPPEPLSHGGLDRTDFQHAREDIIALEQEARKSKPDPELAQEHSNRLLNFGLKIALWLGERATKFTDAALTVLAPVAVAKVTGLMPVLIDAVSALKRILP